MRSIKTIAAVVLGSVLLGGCTGGDDGSNAAGVRALANSPTEKQLNNPAIDPELNKTENILGKRH